MPLRYDATGKWSEDTDVVDPLCVVPDDIDRQYLRAVLEGVFLPEVAAGFIEPAAFNLLLEWVPGDLRWPVATFLLRTGLADGTVHSTQEVSHRLGRGIKSIENVTRPTGHQSYKIMLRDAYHLSGGEARPNEFRRVGIHSVAWTSLARADVRTVDALRSLSPEYVRTIDGVGPKVFAHIYGVLNDTP